MPRILRIRLASLRRSVGAFEFANSSSIPKSELAAEGGEWQFPLQCALSGVSSTEGTFVGVRGRGVWHRGVPAQ